MNLKQFAGVSMGMVDEKSGKVLGWEEYINRVVNKIGLNELKRFLPYDISYIREAYNKDKNLNNTKINDWNRASGFWKSVGEGQNLVYIDLHCGLKEYLPKIGINVFSVSECVCILKEAARMLCESDIDE